VLVNDKGAAFSMIQSIFSFIVSWRQEHDLSSIVASSYTKLSEKDRPLDRLFHLTRDV
jgi:hypothetical protein